MAQLFNRVGNAPRVRIYPLGRCQRGPLGTRLHEPMPTVCLIAFKNRQVAEERQTGSLAV